MATDNKQLMKSDEFNNAILEGVEYKKNILTSYRDQNKNNRERFEEFMMTLDQDIQSILNKKGKNRTDSDKQQLKDFKKLVNVLYK